MSERTYLQATLFNDVTVRWPDAAMPIKVFIAPFRWYETKKQQESHIYKQMVLDAFLAWGQASGGKVKFQYVNDYNQSQIDVKWRRVNRKSLGHTQYEHDGQGRMFSASIEIGISDGVLHAQYDDHGEVSHTIIHEVGHALGIIDHSPDARDIMYVPHQYGIHLLSERDKATINWLYSLPVGFNFKAVAKQYQLNKQNISIHEVVEAIEAKVKGEPLSQQDKAANSATVQTPPASESAKSIIHRPKSLDEHHEILSQMGRFHLRTQNIGVKPKTQAPQPIIQPATDTANQPHHKPIRPRTNAPKQRPPSEAP